MAEIATVARPYADALFKACGAASAQVLPWLEELGVIAANADLQAYVAQPGLAKDKIVEFLSGLVKSPASPQCANFLQTVVENGRVLTLPEVAKQFRAQVYAQSGVFDAVVYSAFALDAAQLAELSTGLERRFGRKLNCRVELDPTLIGGVRVVVGDEVYDASVKARIEQMKVALAA